MDMRQVRIDTISTSPSVTLTHLPSGGNDKKPSQPQGAMRA